MVVFRSRAAQHPHLGPAQRCVIICTCPHPCVCGCAWSQRTSSATHDGWTGGATHPRMTSDRPPAPQAIPRQANNGHKLAPQPLRAPHSSRVKRLIEGAAPSPHGKQAMPPSVPIMSHLRASKSIALLPHPHTAASAAAATPRSTLPRACEFAPQ